MVYFPLLMSSKKEPLVLRAKNGNNSPTSNTSNISNPSNSYGSGCCGASPFFTTKSPSRTAGTTTYPIQTHSQSSRLPTQAHYKSSIHSIARKKSPFKQNTSSVMSRSSQLPLQKRCIAAQAKLSQSNMAISTLQMERNQYIQAYHQLRLTSETEKRSLLQTISQLRTTSDLLKRQGQAMRVENEMIKSRLADRTAKLEECMGILNKRYSHFQRKEEEEGVNRVTKLQGEVMRLKEELLIQYQVNNQLRGRLNENSGYSSVMFNSKCEQSCSDAVHENGKNFELERLEQQYKEELARLQAEIAEQADRPCNKCREMTHTILNLNEQLNSLRKNQTVDYALLINNIIIKQSQQAIPLQ